MLRLHFFQELFPAFEWKYFENLRLPSPLNCLSTFRQLINHHQEISLRHLFVKTKGCAGHRSCCNTGSIYFLFFCSRCYDRLKIHLFLKTPYKIAR